MSKLELTEKEYKALTWFDDVDGLTNRIDENNGDPVLVIFYAVNPSYFEKRISLEDVADTIHDIYDIQEENKKY